MCLLRNITILKINVSEFVSQYISPAFHSAFSDNKFNKLRKGHVDSISFSNFSQRGDVFVAVCLNRENLVIVCRDQSMRGKWKKEFKNISLPLEGMSYKRKSK